MCDGHLNLKEQLRLMNDCDRWARRAEAAEANVGRLKRALNDLAEAAEVAAQGGIHGEQFDGIHPAACGPRCRSQHTDDHSQCPSDIDGSRGGDDG